jgi:hypothetical protein
MKWLHRQYYKLLFLATFLTVWPVYNKLFNADENGIEQYMTQEDIVIQENIRQGGSEASCERFQAAKYEAKWKSLWLFRIDN